MYINVKRVMYAFVMYNKYMTSYMSPNFETFDAIDDVTVQSIQLEYKQCFLVMHSFNLSH